MYEWKQLSFAENKKEVSWKIDQEHWKNPEGSYTVHSWSAPQRTNSGRFTGMTKIATKLATKKSKPQTSSHCHCRAFYPDLQLDNLWTVLFRHRVDSRTGQHSQDDHSLFSQDLEKQRCPMIHVFSKTFVLMLGTVAPLIIPTIPPCPAGRQPRGFVGRKGSIFRRPIAYFSASVYACQDGMSFQGQHSLLASVIIISNCL